MGTTYDVRVWALDVYRGKTTTTYIVQWRVAGQHWKERLKTAALAESFRAELISAARKGEAFDLASGRPVSLARKSETAHRAPVGLCEFASAYTDMNGRSPPRRTAVSVRSVDRDHAGHARRPAGRRA